MPRLELMPAITVAMETETDVEIRGTGPDDRRTAAAIRARRPLSVPAWPRGLRRLRPALAAGLLSLPLLSGLTTDAAAQVHGQWSRITIASADSNAVTEGDSVSFRISASPPPAAPLVVIVHVSQNGDVVAPGDLGNKAVWFAAGQRSVIYTVPTVDDEINEYHGLVHVMVRSAPSYTVGSSQTISDSSPLVRDDDHITHVITRTISENSLSPSLRLID